MKVAAVSSSQLSVSWEPPLEPNGKIIGYNVTWTMIKNDLNQAGDRVLHGLSSLLDAPKRLYQIESLGKRFFAVMHFFLG